MRFETPKPQHRTLPSRKPAGPDSIPAATNYRQSGLVPWLQAAVRSVPPVRPLYPQVRTLRMAVPLVRT